MVALTLGFIVERLGGRLLGSPDFSIVGLASLELARADQISFLSHAKYTPLLGQSQAGCVIVSPAFETAVLDRLAAIVVDDPYLYFCAFNAFVEASLPTCQPGAQDSPFSHR
jgi:UDP-3-O-[3-hydroxymyristoyl] glucosamine N-acyltransferase